MNDDEQIAVPPHHQKSSARRDIGRIRVRPNPFALANGSLFFSAALLCNLCACTVGPNFDKPKTQMPDAFTGLDGSITGAASSKPVAGAADVAHWWTQFNDSILTGLITRAAAANLDIAQAEARIRQARAARAVTASGLYPSIDAAASASRAGNGSNAGNSFRAGFDASWELDIFGGVRRSVEAADAGIVSAIEDRRDVMVTLAAEIGSAYLELRGSQHQLLIAHENVTAQKDTLDLTSQRFEAGFVSALDVANSTAQVASTSSTIPRLEASARASIYALSVLLGQQPASLLEELAPQGPIPTVPSSVPVGLPSQLLLRRPDIRRAESQLHAATALVGAATADLFPKISLTGSAGLQGTQAQSLATLADNYWGIGPAIRWPVFDGGRIRANIAAQEARVDESLAKYKQTVLTALKEVEVALVNFSKEQERRVALIDAEAADRRAVELATELYSAGRTDFLNVLSAQRQLFLAQDALSQSEQTISANLVALYKALGGGWEGSYAQTGGETPSEPMVPAEPMQ